MPARGRCGLSTCPKISGTEMSCRADVPESRSMANYAHDSCTLEMYMINAPVPQPDVVKRVAKAHAPSKVTRKPTNVSLPADLLERARELNVNVSRASERGLREEVQA